ncbi:C4-type zinc ribbon domain-containing protein [Microbacterium kribbense]|uniref:C4-type zinc ribbon domain-containing protein n=1 Tax=Microbacterium kribbense TaxID=433645 RepID=A0ABP7GR42_9MICO
MKSSPAAQQALLDVADLDRRSKQADAARRNPPQTARIRELTELRQTQNFELATRAGARDDVQAEITRIESDVTVARTRQERDRDRLKTVTLPKDAIALENEIASLARRLSDLEDTQLEAMERLETTEEAVAEQEALIAATNDEGGRLSAEAKAIVADSTTVLDQIARDRAAIVANLPADLVARYDTLAERSAGAALLRRGMCEGCRMMLSGSDLSALRQAAEDDVVTCPECGSILVRTDESGL